MNKLEKIMNHLTESQNELCEIYPNGCDDFSDCPANESTYECKQCRIGRTIYEIRKILKKGEN